MGAPEVACLGVSWRSSLLLTKGIIQITRWPYARGCDIAGGFFRLELPVAPAISITALNENGQPSTLSGRQMPTSLERVKMRMGSVG